MNEDWEKRLLNVVYGVILTLTSGLFYALDLSAGTGASVIGYGFPFQWLEKTTLVVPGSPTNYSLAWYGLTLVVDIAFWYITADVVYSIYKRIKKS